MESNSTYSHGDLVNPLLNGYLTGQLHALFGLYNHSILENLARSDDPGWEKKLLLHNHKEIPYKALLKRDLLKRDLLCVSICTTTSLGMFEILSKRLRNANDGKPITLYQEACCVLIVGSTATIAWHPFGLACSRVGLQNLTYTNWFSSLSHIVKNPSMWKCATILRDIAAYTGMLASYDRSLNYLTNTQALPYWGAQISASIISGFFAAACSHSVVYMEAIKDSRAKMRHFPLIIYELLNPYSDFNFYTDFLRRFRYTSRFCMVQYAIFEGLRRVEWIK